MTTEEYLNGFLPLCFLRSMDEASEDALADVLADFILNIASKVCDVEICNRIYDYVGRCQEARK